MIDRKEKLKKKHGPPKINDELHEFHKKEDGWIFLFCFFVADGLIPKNEKIYDYM